METVYFWLIPAMWLAWSAYWLIAARGTKSDSRLESAASRASHILPLMLAAYLLWAHRLPGDFLGGRLWPATAVAFFIGAAIVVLGLGISIWARIVLGRNWSGIVTVKQDHELVRGGPYRWVRHPIYTGCCSPSSDRRSHAANGAVFSPSSLSSRHSGSSCGSRNAGWSRHSAMPMCATRPKCPR